MATLIKHLAEQPWFGSHGTYESGGHNESENANSMAQLEALVESLGLQLSDDELQVGLPWGWLGGC